MLDLAGHIEGFRALVFLAFVLKLSNGSIVVPLELVGMPCIRPMRSVAVRRKIKLEFEAGFDGGFCSKERFLIAIIACLLAVMADLLRDYLRQNEFPADKGRKGKGALLGQIGQSAPHKFKQHGLRNVLLPRLTLKPAGQLLICPSGIHKIEVELIGLAYDLFSNFSCCAKVYFPLDAGIS